MPKLESKTIAVIGAGPAGSVAAIRLAGLGHRVTLFERARFPRDKVCGECLSATGIRVLQRLGIGESMKADLGANRLRRASTVSADGSEFAVALPDEMWGVTRRSMDAWLVARAASAGVRVLTETTADCQRGTGCEPVVSWRGRCVSGAMDRQPFDFAVIGDGSGRTLSPTRPTGDFGIKAHFRNVAAPPDTIELIALSAGYAGLAPVNDGLWNTAWSVPAESLKRFDGDIDALFDDELDRSPALRRRFERAVRMGDWLACPLPRYPVRGAWPPNVIPIGNAAAALEPVGGEGMGLAMRSAELGAEAIDRAARRNEVVDVIALRRQFQRLWRMRRAACRAGAVALTHPFLGPLTVGVAARSPVLARAGLALVGK